jgi:two-component system NtrC family sensor kinase
MSPTSTLRMRRATAALAVGWSLLAILLSLAVLRGPEEHFVPPLRIADRGTVGLVRGLGPGTEQAPVEVGDRLLAVNGEPYLLAVRSGTRGLVEGVPDTYTLEKPDGRRVDVELEPAPLAAMSGTTTVLMHALILLVAVIYLATGGVVWWLRQGRPTAWALLLFCSSLSVLLAMSVQTHLITWSWPILTVDVPLIGATVFHLFTTYPIEPGWVVRHRRMQLVPYAGAALLAVLGLFDVQIGLQPGLAGHASVGFTLGLFFVSLGIAGVERHRHRETPLKDRADIMFLGAMGAFLPVLLVYLAQGFLGTHFDAYYFLALVWVFWFPVAVGWGILRRQLFGVRSVTKSSAAYGAATLAITGVFAFLIVFSDTLVWRLNTSWVEENLRWVQVVFLFFAILAFNPLRNRMQRLVDGFFDRDRATYRVAVREISEAMVSMLSLSEIADRILLALTDTMGVERAMVMLVDDDGKLLRPIASRGDWDEEALATEIPSDHPIWKQLWMRREDLSRVDFDDEHDVEHREACRDVFDTLEVELLVPILYGVDLLGVIAVGRKLSGDRLVTDDRLLLRTLANQSSVAIENAKAFDEIAKLNETLEARVDERTRELRETQAQLVQAEKMKSLGQLVAGVAHELNNPIGFVHANLQLLDEYIRKLTEGQRTESDTARIQEAIAKLLLRSREGTERVKKIVQDLRTFSRMDQAEIQVVDLHEEIDRTLALMEPRFKNNIHVVRDYGDIPRVRCNPGQMNQVFLNLLMNACDAIERDGTVTIRTRAKDGGVRLEFHDDGPGISAEVQSRIFDPFFTTKPVGVGTGLGLSLSHGIIERHGGRIFVGSDPGAGTTFVIDLPLIPTPPEGVEVAEGDGP